MLYAEKIVCMLIHIFIPYVSREILCPSGPQMRWESLILEDITIRTIILKRRLNILPSMGMVSMLETHSLTEGEVLHLLYFLR